MLKTTRNLILYDNIDMTLGGDICETVDEYVDEGDDTIKTPEEAIALYLLTTYIDPASEADVMKQTLLMVDTWEDRKKIYPVLENNLDMYSNTSRIPQTSIIDVCEQLLSDADLLPLDFVARVMFAIRNIPSSTHVLQKFSADHPYPDVLADAFRIMLIEKNVNYTFSDAPVSIRLGLADNPRSSKRLISELIKSYRSGDDSLSLLNHLMRSLNLDCLPTVHPKKTR